jgi:hypothetical protein
MPPLTSATLPDRYSLAFAPDDYSFYAHFLLLPQNFNVPISPYPFSILLPSFREINSSGPSRIALPQGETLEFRTFASLPTPVPTPDPDVTPDAYTPFRPTSRGYLELIRPLTLIGGSITAFPHLAPTRQNIPFYPLDIDRFLGVRITELVLAFFSSAPDGMTQVTDQIHSLIAHADNGLLEPFGHYEPAIGHTYAVNTPASNVPSPAQLPDPLPVNDATLTPSPSPSPEPNAPLLEPIVLNQNINAYALVRMSIAAIPISTLIRMFASTTFSPADQQLSIPFSDMKDFLLTLTQLSQTALERDVFRTLSNELRTLALQYAYFYLDNPNMRSTTAFLAPTFDADHTDNEVIRFALSHVLAIHRPDEITTFLSGHFHQCPLGFLCPLNVMEPTHDRLTTEQYLSALDQSSQDSSRIHSLIRLVEALPPRVTADSESQTDPTSHAPIPPRTPTEHLRANEMAVLTIRSSSGLTTFRLSRIPTPLGHRLTLCVESQSANRVTSFSLSSTLIAFVIMLLGLVADFILAFFR